MQSFVSLSFKPAATPITTRSFLRCWLFFHREISPDVPEAAEVMRFQQTALKAGIELQVLQPRDFDLIVDSDHNWSAMYRGRKLSKPDMIIPRTGSESSYFTLA